MGKNERESSFQNPLKPQKPINKRDLNTGPHWTEHWAPQLSPFPGYFQPIGGWKQNHSEIKWASTLGGDLGLCKREHFSESFSFHFLDFSEMECAGFQVGISP